MTKQFLMQYFGLVEADRERYPYLFILIDSVGDLNG